jgi:hypothetical protein
VVTQNTTINEVFERLGNLGRVPSTGRGCLYFTAGLRRATCEDTMETLNLGPLSNLHMRVAVLGGAPDGMHISELLV